MSGAEAISHFARFYVTTSLAWDTFRAVGNAAMILLLGSPVLAAMARFRSRFSLVVERSDTATAAAASQPHSESLQPRSESLIMVSDATDAERTSQR
jgi:energy-coupling factor transport system substrate-specific component